MYNVVIVKEAYNFKSDLAAIVIIFQKIKEKENKIKANMKIYLYLYIYMFMVLSLT